MLEAGAENIGRCKLNWKKKELSSRKLRLMLVWFIAEAFWAITKTSIKATGSGSAQAKIKSATGRRTLASCLRVMLSVDLAAVHGPSSM